VSRYEVRFDGKQSWPFDDLDEACEWAQELAATGRVADVVEVRRFTGRIFITAYPESERMARIKAWASRAGWRGGGMV
jgi:hypothetical protein